MLCENCEQKDATKQIPVWALVTPRLVEGHRLARMDPESIAKVCASCAGDLVAQGITARARRNAAREARPIDERMSELAQSFHALRGVPGARPWDAAKLEAWALGPSATPATAQCVGFVLRVWNTREHGEGWRVPFDAVSAMGRWDPRHREAFLAWVADPWFA